MEREQEYPPRFLVTGGASEAQRARWRRAHLEIAGRIPGEREKTEEDSELIAYCTERGKKIGERYGFSWHKAPENNIRYIDEDSFVNRYRKYIPDIENTGGVTVRGQHMLRDMPSALWRAATTMHEMVHGQAKYHYHIAPEEYKTAFFTSGELPKAHLRRMGLDVAEGQGFSDLNEAVTELIAQEALLDIEKDEHAPESLRKEVERLERLMPWFEQRMNSQPEALADEEAYRVFEKFQAQGAAPTEIDAFVQDYKERHYGRPPYKHSYQSYQHDYVKLLDDLLRKNSDAFSEKKELHRLFVRALANGEILPVARLIEQAYGKGSFRELGQGPAAESAIPEDKTHAPEILHAFVKKYVPELRR